MKPTYHVKVLAAQQQLEVTLVVPEAPAATFHLDAPTWVPGAYAFLRYARDVFSVAVVDAGVRATIVERDGWSSFKVAGAKSGAPVTLRWLAAGSDPAFAELAGYVRHDQAVLLGTRYLAVRGHDGPVRVVYETPAGWDLHHPSGAVRVDARTFDYASFAELLDTPVVTGRFDRRTRALDGATFHCVFLDEGYGYAREVDGFVERVMKQAARARDVFGAFPFDDYTFVCSFDPRAHWGLEHATSTMVGLGELALVDPEQRFVAVRVCGHELFHAWNVCRMKPSCFTRGRLDLVEGSFTDELWIAEGWTRYYEFVMAVRAGEIPAARFFSNVVRYWQTLTGFPAYGRASVVDSSRATFLNHHHWPGMINAAFDYYGYGMLVAFDLDVALRTTTPGGSLDAELRTMWEAFGARAEGYTHDDAVRLLSSRNPAIGALAKRESEGVANLSVPARLEALGFEVEWKELPRLGIVLDEKRPAAGFVTNVADDSPAAQAGLAADDEIVRVGGLAYQRKGLLWAIEHEPKVTLEVRRGHAFHAFTIEPSKRRVVAGLVFKGTEEQAALLQTWLALPAPPFAACDRVPLDFYDNFHGNHAVV